MLKFVVLLLIGLPFMLSEEVSRSDATAQRQQGIFVAPLRRCVRNDFNQLSDYAVEVFQVLDLPINVHEASLVKSERGYLVKLAVSNSSEVKIVGLRYSLVFVDSNNQIQPLLNRTEGFALPAYATRSLTFKTPFKFKSKDDERVVLMLEQVISRESIWEVVKAKDALEAYARGDYSVLPTVLRVANQVDAPMTPRVIYRLRRNEEY